jgi:hemolysin activation/secretion protein
MSTLQFTGRFVSTSCLCVLLAITFSFDQSYAQIFAQDRPGEVLQQIEKERREQELLRKEEQKRPPVTIEQEKKAPTKVPLVAGRKVLVKKFNIEGNKLFSTADLNALVAPQVGKELTLEDLRNVADLITAKYRDSGYIIANAFLPAQEIKDNVVTIRIVEGRVGAINATGYKSYSSSFIEKHLARVRKDPTLKEAALERSLLILNDYPSLEVKAALKPGKEPGTTDLIATASNKTPPGRFLLDRFTMSGRIFYDNYGTPTTGKNRGGFGLDIGNILAGGDDLNLWGITGLDTLDVNRLSYGRAEYSLPLGGNGTRGGIYYANNLFQASGELTPLGLEGKANIAGIWATHPLIKTREHTLNVRVGFDYKNINEYALQDLVSKDHIRVATLGIGYDSVDRFLGKNYLGITYHKGIKGFIGGTGYNESDLSRQGADGGFDKITADVLRIQKLPGYNHILLRATGQYSDDLLFVAEQYMIGGAGSVRGFNPAERIGDIGYTLTAEAVLSPFFPEKTIFNQKIGDTIKFALFVDHGYVRRNSPLPGDIHQAYLTGIGAGIRLYAGNIFSLKLDYGIPKEDSTFETRKSVTYLQAMISF